MFGNSVVSCDIGTCLSYVNVHQDTGLQVPGADSKAFAQAMTEIEQNPALAETLGKNARKRFEEHFTSKRYAESYVSLYQSLANN